MWAPVCLARRCRALFSAAPRCCHKCHGKLDCAVDQRPGAVGVWPRPRRRRAQRAPLLAGLDRGGRSHGPCCRAWPHGCVARPGPPQAAGALAYSDRGHYGAGDPAPGLLLRIPGTLFAAIGWIVNQFTLIDYIKVHLPAILFT